MRLEDYTAEAICQSMGLATFIEPAWSFAQRPTLRTIFKPSFHSELCVTLSQQDGIGRLSVVAFRDQFWRSVHLARAAHDVEAMPVQVADIERIIVAFRVACTVIKPEQRTIAFDGMGTDSCVVSAGSVAVMEHRAGHERFGDDFLRELARLAWETCQNPRIRNALADIFLYLGERYPQQTIPPESPTCQVSVAILGTPDERQAVLQMLRHRGPPGSDAT